MPCSFVDLCVYGMLFVWLWMGRQASRRVGTVVLQIIHTALQHK
jgi:hypothetical protein